MGEGSRKKSEGYSAAGHGIPDHNEGDRSQAGSRQPGDGLAGGDKDDEHQRAQETHAHQGGAGTGQSAEDHIQRQNAAPRGQQRETDRTSDAPPQPEPTAKQEQAEASDDTRDQQAQLEDEGGQASPVSGRKRRDVKGPGAAMEVYAAMEREITAAFRDVLGPGTEAYADLLSSVLIGVTFARQVARTGTLAELTSQELVDYLAPAIRALLAPAITAAAGRGADAADAR
jgi:Tetracyclin repressor-like, C-terminal domain